ncbi:hypothetical protein J2810_003295 [Chryseobacterium rhizosphaerae]|uniref:Abi-alpha family protein n=1 Tax=Chryseobacterium rhizosphaerae TaxID=395937 RepID=UPI002854DFA8|nr:Abi-alpha family protein [Chryseobacterium rhizosphaerae]MDR6547224.1 hypothetical protein [Chryseobacterium rhizosphaerae]
MESNNSQNTNSGFDIIGLGKTAEAIPKEVYVEATKGLINTFNDIISPLTQTTSGIGRYIRQKFDNMVEVEKAIGALTLQNAIEKAKKQGDLRTPKHLKSFINSFEEASKETDDTLHDMWENIIASQISESEFHPRYVNILSNLTSDEAKLLLSLNTIQNLGKDYSSYLGSPRDGFIHFVTKNHELNLQKWTYSCNVLLEFELANVMAPNPRIYNIEDRVTILYSTNSGKRFLEIVKK